MLKTNPSFFFLLFYELKSRTVTFINTSTNLLVTITIIIIIIIIIKHI